MFVRKTPEMVERDAEICRLYQTNDYTAQMLAEKYGLKTTARIFQILHAHGIPSRQRGQRRGKAA